jgi:hypothetical protein
MEADENEEKEGLNGGQRNDGSKHPLLRPERSLHREIGNRIGGDDVPTRGIPRSKERPLVQEERSEGRWEEERTSGCGGSDGSKHPLLRPERSLD